MQKIQFRIGELAKQLAVEKFVIRFWEKEFNVTTNRSRGGQRFYTQDDLDQFMKIKSLLYEQGFTIAGAKKLLLDKPQAEKMVGSYKTQLTTQEQQPSFKLTPHVEQLRQQLIILRNLL